MSALLGLDEREIRYALAYAGEQAGGALAQCRVGDDDHERLETGDRRGQRDPAVVGGSVDAYVVVAVDVVERGSVSGAACGRATGRSS